METFKFTSKTGRVDGATNPDDIPLPEDASEPLRKAEIRRLLVKINEYGQDRAGSRRFHF